MKINGIDISKSQLRARGYESLAVSILSAASTGTWSDPRLSISLSSNFPHGGDISAAALYQAWRDLKVSDTNAIRAVFIALSESGLRGDSKNASSGATGLYQGLGAFKPYVKASLKLADHLPMMRAMMAEYGLDKREVSLWAFYAMHAQGRFASWDPARLDEMRGFVNKDRGTYDVGYGAQFSTTNGLSSCNDFGVLVLVAMIRGLHAAGLADTTSISLTIPNKVCDFKQKDSFFIYNGPYAPFRASKHIEPGSGNKIVEVGAKAQAHAPVTSSTGKTYISTSTVMASNSKPPTTSGARAVKGKSRLFISTID